MIRLAQQADIAGILAVWNFYVRETTVTFASVPKTAAGVAALMAERRQQGFEIWVAEAEGRVQGFASYAQFRGGEGYARTMEHSVMLSPGAQGKGLGRGLMAAVAAHAFARGGHTLYAGVSAENAAGQAFHAAIGFAPVAVLAQAGWKFERWIDLVLMQKKLQRPLTLHCSLR